jgi:hypothetical protein
MVVSDIVVSPLKKKKPLSIARTKEASVVPPWFDPHPDPLLTRARECRAHFAITGEPGLIYFALEQMFNQSTPERRSALLLDEGSQPVTFTLWQEVRAYSSRSTSSSFNCMRGL